MGKAPITYYVAFELQSKWLQRRTLMGAVVEITGGLRRIEDYNALHRTLLNQAQSEHGKNKAWSLVLLNWQVLPGSE